MTPVSVPSSFQQPARSPSGGEPLSTYGIVSVGQHLNWAGTGGGPLRVQAVGSGAFKLRMFLALGVSGSPTAGFGYTIGEKVVVPDGSILRDLPSGREYVVRDGRIRSG